MRCKAYPLLTAWGPSDICILFCNICIAFCKFAATFVIHRQYDLGGALHSSSDGQKFETQLPTLNARYSPKYFGLKKGASPTPWWRTTSRSTRKSLGQTSMRVTMCLTSCSTIRPISNPRFILRIRTGPTRSILRSSTASAISSPRATGTFLIQWVHPCTASSIPASTMPRWCSDPCGSSTLPWLSRSGRTFSGFRVPGSKTTTQNSIVGKLSAFARTNKTRRALWEYDNMLRRLYLLDYIDSPPLRQ